MKRGFTLVELLVVITIMGLLSGGAMVYINKGRSREKIVAAKNELLANVRMARNYARSLQIPAGYGGTLTHVGVRITSDGTMTVYPYPPFGATPNFFVRDVATDGASITTSSDIMFFSAYEGKVLKMDDDGLPVMVPLAVGETFSIIIGSGEDIDDTKTIVVTSSGLISENDLLEVEGGGGGQEN